MRYLALMLNAVFLLLLLLVVYRVARGALSDIGGGREAAPAPGSHLRRLDDGSTIRLRLSNTVGRDPDCDIVIDDTFTSSKHATIAWTKGRWTVTDLGSTNGTMVGGDQVMSAEIADGDQVTFGRTTFVMEER